MKPDGMTPTTEARMAFKRAELHRSHWCEECASEAAAKERERILAAMGRLPWGRRTRIGPLEVWRAIQERPRGHD